MLKRFFISMLGTIAGIWLSLILFVVCSIVGMTLLIAKLIGDSGSVVTPKEGILHINLTGVINEYPEEWSFNSLYNDEEVQNLCDITNAIRLAANDKKIEGMLIDCKGTSLGIASRQEILEAVTIFGESGKWIIAYGDNYTQGDYYIASGADRIYLNPVGTVGVTGLCATTMFFKNLLEKIGVEVQVVKVGQFKSAVEPFIRTEMSEPSEYQTRTFLTQIWDDMTSAIAENREVEPTDINMWADSLAFTWDPKRYVTNKVVTALKYRNEVENEIRQKLKLKDTDDIPYILPADYISNNTNKFAKIGKKHIAVLYAVGDISDAGTTGITAEQMVPEIENLTKDKNVAALVLRVNSGGGSAFASEQIWHALENFKASGKPFYVSMGDYAASGGYYISCGADKIFADPTTLTGSIGIFGLMPNAQDLFNNKLGVNFQMVETNPGACIQVPYKPLDETQLAAMQRYVSRGYETFVDRVNQGRNLGIDSIMAIGGGRVWDGISALNIGLVDELGCLHDAIEEIAIEVELDGTDFINYPTIDNSFANFLFKNANVNVNVNNLPVDEFLPYIEAVRQAKDLNPIQARMEPLVVK